MEVAQFFIVKFIYFLALVLTLSSEPAFSRSCRGVFDSSSEPTFSKINDSKSFKSFFYSNLTHDDPSKDLGLRWRMPYKASVTLTENGTWKRRDAETQMTDATAAPNDPVNPIHLRRKTFGTGLQDYRFYPPVYAHYEGVIDSQLIQNLNLIDKSLEQQRTSIGEVYDLNQKDGLHHLLYGTFRIYDGSARPFGLSNSEPLASAVTQGGTLLPYQRLNQHLALPRLKVDSYLDHAKLSGQKVFEVGKFSIERTPEFASRTRNLIESFWLQHFASVYPDAIFVAHVASRVHVRHYQSRYKMRVAERFEVPAQKDEAGEPGIQTILWIEGWRLAERLRELTGITAISDVPPQDSEQWELPDLNTGSGNL